MLYPAFMGDYSPIIYCVEDMLDEIKLALHLKEKEIFCEALPTFSLVQENFYQSKTFLVR